MKKKCVAQSGFFPLRVSFTLLLWAVASLVLGTTVLGFFRAEAPRRVSETRLTFAERVAYQRAIEERLLAPPNLAKGAARSQTIARCRDFSGAAGKESCGLPA